MVNEFAKENSQEAEALKNWSLDILQKSLKSNITGGQKLQAQFSLMDYYANENEHDKVLATFRTGPFSEKTSPDNTSLYPAESPQDLTARVLLLAAKSSLAKGLFKESKEFSIGVARATKDETLLTEATALKAKAEEEL